MWTIEFRETARDTLVKTTDHEDLPIRGRVWIEPETGRLVMSQIVAENRELRSQIDVSLQSEPLLVPIEMQDSYIVKSSGTRIEGVATYGRFRRFQVNVHERFTPPDTPRR